MSFSFEEVKKYLPQYLSSAAEKVLYKELDQFPANIDSRFYSVSTIHDKAPFQGDGLKDLLFIELPNTKVGEAPGMVMSNTCDINPANERLVPHRMVYAPIINLDKYEANAIKNYVNTGIRTKESIDSHISHIRKQLVSHIFYLPRSGRLEYDSIVFFDRINNCSSESFDVSNLKDQRIFKLSDYGFYLFVFKLSYHFTRIREGMSRDNSTA